MLQTESRHPYEPLYKAIHRRDVTVEELQSMVTSGVIPDQLNDFLDAGLGTPLHHVCWGNYNISLPIVKFLIQYGCKPGQLNECNRTALHYVCGNTSATLPIIEFLVANGCNPNQRDTSGRIPLYYACWSNLSEEIVEFLIRHTTTENLNVPDMDGITPLHRLCENRANKPDA